jgi:hypothetical protein
MLDDELDIFANPRDVIRETWGRAVTDWHEETTFHLVQHIIGAGSKLMSLGHHTISTDQTEASI